MYDGTDEVGSRGNVCPFINDSGRHRSPRPKQTGGVMGSVIGLEEAREILGDEGIGMSDESLLEEIRHFENIARLVVRNFKVLKNGTIDVLEVL